MADQYDGTSHVRVAIIGAGPGGLCMAKELLDAGITDFTVLEKWAGVGGTWFINRYPGCACDVQSALYSFSWELKTDWSRPYGTQPEILAYFEHIADKYAILPHCRFNTEVVSAKWLEDESRWLLELSNGSSLVADVVVSALGMFKDPTLPNIQGVKDFEGVTFHSSRWDWSQDLHGKRVAVIGTAASAVQLVPKIVLEAGHVDLYQRTANWILPKIDTPYSEEQLKEFRENPDIIRNFRQEIYTSMDAGMTFSDENAIAEREIIGLKVIDVVEDPLVREQLKPTHPWGCKRPLFSNEYYPAFNRPNLDLITDPINHITSTGIVTDSGEERPVDIIVFATGYTTTKYVSAVSVTGRDGAHLDDVWEDGAMAYLGISTPGFPNLYMLYGPNTNNGSILTMIESQVAHILAQLDWMDRDKLAWIDAKTEHMVAYNEDVQEGISKITVWQADCSGYYTSRTGRNVTQWPFSMSEFARRTATINPDAYEVATVAS
jgi:cation diffusion facilitator CzcD-associated flavoprotein CzcO